MATRKKNVDEQHDDEQDAVVPAAPAVATDFDPNPNLPQNPPEPEGLAQPEPPVGPVNPPEPEPVEDPVDNRTRDGLQVPVNPPEPDAE